MREEMIKDCFNAIDTVACSPRVKHFYLGYTYWTALHRLREQRNQDTGWDYVVTIAEKLTWADANKLEIELKRLCKEEERNYVTYTKYHKKHRDRPFNPGKKSPTPKKHIHTVYMMFKVRG
jgi:hypothetical protein